MRRLWRGSLVQIANSHCVEKVRQPIIQNIGHQKGNLSHRENE